jgi:hypothetical protein
MSSVFHGEPGGHARSVRDVTFGTPKRPSTGTVKGHKPLLTDAEILEMRALSEFSGWTREQLMARFVVDYDMVYRVLSGVTRSRLVATRKHLPKNLEPA